jgi:hypothetical protein
MAAVAVVQPAGVGTYAQTAWKLLPVICETPKKATPHVNGSSDGGDGVGGKGVGGDGAAAGVGLIGLSERSCCRLNARERATRMLPNSTKRRRVKPPAAVASSPLRTASDSSSMRR